MTEPCKHVKLVTNYFGEVVERKYPGLFCPDCGVRIQEPGPTRPFHLKPHQR